MKNMLSVENVNDLSPSIMICNIFCTRKSTAWELVSRGRTRFLVYGATGEGNTLGGLVDGRKGKMIVL
jgi:hypothetical protein